MQAYIQLYRNQNEFGLYRFNTEKITGSNAYTAITALWNKHYDDSEAFNNALNECGIERILIDIEIDLSEKSSEHCDKVSAKTELHTIKWKEDGASYPVLFGVGEKNDEIDGDVFYWVKDKAELGSLKSRDNDQDFYIVG